MNNESKNSSKFFKLLILFRKYEMNYKSENNINNLNNILISNSSEIHTDIVNARSTENNTFLRTQKFIQ